MRTTQDDELTLSDFSVSDVVSSAASKDWIDPFNGGKQPEGSEQVNGYERDGTRKIVRLEDLSTVGAVAATKARVLFRPELASGSTAVTSVRILPRSSGAGHTRVIIAAIWESAQYVVNGCNPPNAVPNSDEQQVSISGQRCLNWLDTVSRHNSTIPLDIESGIWNHSFCRSPDDSGIPWCYILDPEETVQKQHCASNTCKDTPQSPDRPDAGVSKRARAGHRKDLGVLGYVLGTLMMTIILLLGSGIIIGYFYKRGQSLMREQEQQVCEREMQRINLPLSAFSNQACDLLDETPAPATVQETPKDKREEEEENEEKDERPGDQIPLEHEMDRKFSFLPE